MHILAISLENGSEINFNTWFCSSYARLSVLCSFFFPSKISSPKGSSQCHENREKSAQHLNIFSCWLNTFKQLKGNIPSFSSTLRTSIMRDKVENEPASFWPDLGSKGILCNYSVITICFAWHILLLCPQVAASALRGSSTGLWLGAQATVKLPRDLRQATWLLSTWLLIN